MMEAQRGRPLPGELSRRPSGTVVVPVSEAPSELAKSLGAHLNEPGAAAKIAKANRSRATDGKAHARNGTLGAGYHAKRPASSVK